MNQAVQSGNSDKLRGLVLSGGESRRMGRDKGLISSDLAAWVNGAAMLLQNLKLPVSVMIRETQRAEYAAVVLPDFELFSDLDLPVGGPLKGLLSFQRLYPQNDVLVLSCDMPNMTVEILGELIAFYSRNPDYEAWVFENKEVLQPFPGIYSSRFLTALLEKMENESLSKHGLTHLLASANTAQMAISEEFVFQNFNSPTDL